MTDEREKLPSASSLVRYYACPGSFLLEANIPDVKKSDDAATGDRIHAALAGETVHLSHEEEKVFNLCRKIELELLERLNIPDDSRVLREQRLWYTSEDWEKLWSGKPDAIYFDRPRALIIDYKTGRGEVEDPSSNLQLRALAVLLRHVYGVQEISVAIIQPYATMKPEVCTYTEEDLQKAHDEICSVMNRVKQPNQPIVPTVEGCKYCKAKGVHCPHSREAAIAPPMSDMPANITPDAIAATLTSQKLGDFLKRAAMAESIIEACKEEAKRRLSDGDTIPGWTLKPGAVRQKICKPEEVFARFVKAGGNQDLFMSTVTISNGSLKESLKLTTGASGQDLEYQFAELIEGCVETSTSSPSLVKAK